MSFDHRQSKHSFWTIREYRNGALEVALAGGCLAGLLYLQSGGVKIPLWAVVTLYACIAVNALNGCRMLKEYFDEAIYDPTIEPQSVFKITIATVLVAPGVGAALGILSLGLIRGWIPGTFL